MAFRLNAITGNLDLVVPAASGGNAPANATYVTVTANATLTNERILTGSDTITITDGGANSTVTVDTQGVALSNEPFVIIGNSVASSVVLLLHADGVDGSTTFTDSSISAKTVTAGGNAQIDTAEKKFGTGSALFDGSGDYLTSADSADWFFSNGNLTIDTWVRFNSVATTQMIYSQILNSSNEIQFYYFQPTSRLYFYTQSASVVLLEFSAAWVPVINTWYHVALVRNGNTWLMFIDGVSQSLTLHTGSFSATLPDFAAAISIGAYSSTTSFFNGWMDEFRVTKGVAQWTSNFTPPAAAYDVNDTLTNERSLTGTADQIVITDNGANSTAVLSLATLLKNINVEDSSFSIKDNLDNTKIAQFQASTIATATTRTFTFPDASGTLALTTSAAPVDAQYVTLATNATLTNERVLTGTANQIILTDNGAGSTIVLSTPQNIGTGSSPTFTGLTLSGLTPGSVIFAGTGGLLSQDNANFFFDDTNNGLSVGRASSQIILNSVTTNTQMATDTDSNILGHLAQAHSNTATARATIAMAKSKGTAASPTIVALGDTLGGTTTYGYSGNSGVGYLNAAETRYLSCITGTTVSTTSMPGRLSFWTVPDLSLTLTERLRIDCTGLITSFGNIQMSANKIIGDTASGGNLTLNSTSSATKGDIVLDDTIEIWPSIGDLTASTNIINHIPTNSQTISGASATQTLLNYAPTFTYNFNTSAVLNHYLLHFSPVATFSQGLALIYNAFLFDGSFTSTANPNFANTFNMFVGQPVMSSATAGVVPIPITTMYAANPTFSAGNANIGSGTFDLGYGHNPTYQTTGASSIFTGTQTRGFLSACTFKANTAASALTMTDRKGFVVATPAYTATGTVTVTNDIGFEFADQLQTAGNRTVTTIKALNLLQNAGASVTWNIFISGTADNAITGNLRLGDTTAPTTLLDIAGKTTITSAGLVTKYNNIAAVSNGVPAEYATVDLATQAAAIAATTIYTPTATGMFRISIYLQVTRAATTSSILGGATGVVITYNDGDGNVAQSNTAALATTAGAIAITAAGNSTVTNLEGTMVIYARTGVAIQYAIGYTSVGVTTMQYAAHLKVEAL